MLWLPELKALEIWKLPQSFNSQKVTKQFCSVICSVRMFCWKDVTSNWLQNPAEMAASQQIEWHHPSGFAKYCMPMQNKMATTHHCYTKTRLPLTPYIPLSRFMCHQKILIKFYFKRWYPCLLGSWLHSPSRMHVPGYLMDPLVPDSQEAVPWTSCNCHAILCHTKTAYPVVVTC
jgi:hypothetical protein